MLKDLKLYTEKELLKILDTLDDCRVRVDSGLNKVFFEREDKLVLTYELYFDESFKGYLVTDYR